MTFAFRAIDVTLQEGGGLYGDVPLGTATTYSGLRVHADISFQGQASTAIGDIKIFGLPKNVVEKYTSIGFVSVQSRLANTILIAAGDRDDQMYTVLEGTIQLAYGDYQSTPDVSLNIHASSGTAIAMKPVGAHSFIGSPTVNEIMGVLAKSVGLDFTPNPAVTAVLTNPYFSGSASRQIYQCARHADINYSLDKTGKTLHIWPKGAARADSQLTVVSYKTNMVKYPIFSEQFLTVNAEFLPNVEPGWHCQVESTIPLANDTWNIVKITHKLQSETPNGQWFTQLDLGHNIYGKTQ